MKHLQQLATRPTQPSRLQNYQNFHHWNRRYYHNPFYQYLHISNVFINFWTSSMASSIPLFHIVIG